MVVTATGGARAEDPTSAGEARNRTTLELFETGDVEAALAAAREAVRANQQALGEGHEQTAAARFNLALILSLRGAYDEAEALHLKALAARRAMPNAGTAVADSLLALGQMNRNRGHYADAEAQMREALALRLTTAGAETAEAAQVHEELSRLYRVQDRFAEAEDHQLAALRVYEMFLGPSHPLVARRLSELPGIRSGTDRGSWSRISRSA